MKFLTIFPFFLSIGLIISSILLTFFKDNSQMFVLLAYTPIIFLFLFLNYSQVAYLLEAFFGVRRNWILDFIFTIITFGYYIPYYLLSIAEQTGIFKKKYIFFSFLFPFPSFFLFCDFLYSSLVKR